MKITKYNRHIVSKYYWDEYNTFGPEDPPANVDEVISAANDMIDEFIKRESEEYVEDCIGEFCHRLWWEFCQTGIVNGVEAIYE